MVLGLIALLLFAAIEYAWIKYNGTPVPVPKISRQPQTIGHGPDLTYVVLGDSTAVAQGAPYAQGYAVATANYLAKNYTLTWVNLAVSGARAHDVATKQLPRALPYRPDLVLIAVGANDVTHLTSLDSVRHSLQSTITALRRANSNVKIVLTGSPDMGAVPRLPQPLRWLAGERTKSLNAMVMQLAAQQHVTFAPIARQTGPVFRKHPDLFASDKFHPNAGGYKLWIPVLTTAIRQSLSS
jgi:lysophospholipase L1-like esterase